MLKSGIGNPGPPAPETGGGPGHGPETQEAKHVLCQYGHISLSYKHFNVLHKYMIFRFSFYSYIKDRVKLLKCYVNDGIQTADINTTQALKHSSGHILSTVNSYFLYVTQIACI